MREKRITAFIGIYGSLILSGISTGQTMPIINLALAFVWALRYGYLSGFRKNG